MASVLQTASPDAIRRVQRIQAITIAWMSVEALVSLFAASRARSPALLAFGGDSAIELFSAVVGLWRFRASAAHADAERRAARVAGALLFALAAYVAITSVASLLGYSEPKPTLLGIAILVAAASWGVLPSTAAKNMSVVKAFFEFCHANEWTPRNPARMVRNQRGQHNDPRSEQKLPFSDEELKRMYDACDTKYGKREIQFSKATKERKEQGPYAQYRTRWTGQDIADFISVSVYTGLRISDVSTFHIDRMRPDGTIQLRTTKAHTHVYTWVPEWLQQRIRTRALETGPYIFGEHSTTDMNVITDLWRRKLNKLWEL